jgi:hypothetical protein
MNNPDYETIYGVGLLDDIHNYFPAILYDSGRFQGLPSMMSYVRTQMNNRFNLFNHGATRAGFRRNPFPASAAFTSPYAPPFASTGFASREESFIFPGRVRRSSPPFASANAFPHTPQMNQAVTESESALRTLLAFLNAETDQEVLSPMVVAPSQTVLRMNTRVISGSSASASASASLEGSTCSICQDGIISTDTCRSLIPCGHVYHKACIDQWFLRSVFCPTCRHDIRTAQSPQLSSFQANAANPDLPQL